MSDSAPPPEANVQTGGGAARPAAAGNLVNLFGLDRERLREEFARMGEKPYRADQVMQWIYRRGVDDFDA
ncbi:MAG TPA: hypothetical protein VNX47_13475, partial [Nevskia sp.]|nr:hypothetical protein [Nevskia sp.]